MVMMALEGLERILQIGEEKAKQLTSTSDISHLYSKLLPANKIEEICMSKSNPSIARRANKIWRNHFVLCALCNISFPKQSEKANFCAECKCHVCSKVCIKESIFLSFFSFLSIYT